MVRVKINQMQNKKAKPTKNNTTNPPYYILHVPFSIARRSRAPFALFPYIRLQPFIPMRYIILLSCLLLPLLWSCGGENSVRHKEDKTDTLQQYSIAQFMKTESIRGASFSPDGVKVFYSSDKDGIFNIYEIPSEGGEARQITHSKDASVQLIGCFPEDERLLYAADKGGNEISHLYVRETDGKITELTPWPEARASFVNWSLDRQSFYFASNRRDPKNLDLYQVEVADLTPKLVFKNTEAYEIDVVSAESGYVMLRKVFSNKHSRVFAHSLSTGQTFPVTGHEPNVNYKAAGFSPSGKLAYLATDKGSEFSYYLAYDFISGKSSKVNTPNWDVSGISFSPSGNYRTLRVNRDGLTEMELMDFTTGKPVSLPELRGFNISRPVFSADERKLLVSAGNSVSPPDLYIIHLPDGRTTRLTHAMNPEINPAHLVKSRVIRFRSFDNMEIPAMYYAPHQANSKDPAPAIVWVHGGPGGQSRQTYFPLLQYLVNHGYAIMAVNNRGSSGYGKTFYGLDDRRHGEGDLQDCIYAKAYMGRTGKIDTSHTAILGGSYGGFMVLAALAFQPDAFDAGVDIFGVSNWIRTLKSIPPWWQSFRSALVEELGDPVIDSTRLKQISPLFHAQKIKKPLMVVQGANDPRVLKVESDEIVKAVKANGVPVEYLVFEDEGHGFEKKENQIKANEAILKFLDQYLRVEPEL